MEAAEVGAEEREQVALFSTSGADGAETREQLSRESSAVRGSEVGRKQPKKAHDSQINRESTIHPPPQTISCYGILITRFQIGVQPEKMEEMGLKSPTFYRLFHRTTEGIRQRQKVRKHEGRRVWRLESFDQLL